MAPEVRWRPLDADRAVAAVASEEVTVSVSADGALTALSMSRWGPLGRGLFGECPFGATFEDHLVAHGVRVPRRVTAGYGFGIDRWAEEQFLRWTVVDLSLH